MKAPIRVAVTGAAGQIGYSLLFRIASGEMLGKDQPVILQLLEIPDEKAQKALKGVMMELEDCAFPLLAGMEAHADPMTAFKDTDYALLVGSRPRGPGMERAELLAINGAIFVDISGAAGQLSAAARVVMPTKNRIKSQRMIRLCHRCGTGQVPHSGRRRNHWRDRLFLDRLHGDIGRCVG